MGIAFYKGHGTENDFVVLPDPNGMLELTASQVRALCDQHRGLGADGVLRVVPTRLVADAPPGIDGDTWFMDYRNADGSVAEMCGNGVRVFVAYLIDAGLAEPGNLVIGTRAGRKDVTSQPNGDITVHMGRARITGRSAVTIAGRTLPGIAVDTGNPHLVCPVDADLDQLDLSVQPEYDHSVFPYGVNIEFVHQIEDSLIRMRVYERGVGETRSCGTGTVAAVAALAHASGRQGSLMTVVVPGGQLAVTVDESSSTLTGPVALVARGELSDEWWNAAHSR